MKIYTLLLLFCLFSISGYAKTETDTITTWKIYKDDKLILESSIFDNTHTIKISKSEDFEKLTILILSDIHTANIKRNIKFLSNDKVRMTFTQQLPFNYSPLIIDKKTLLRLVGPDTNVVFGLAYTDSDSDNLNMLCNFILTD